MRGLLFWRRPRRDPRRACGERQDAVLVREEQRLSQERRQDHGHGPRANAVRVTDGTKFFDVLFLPSGASADAYAKRFNVPSGILHTQGNAIVYGHQTGGGRE